MDAIIVQGAEAGGYTRTAVGLMGLLPAVADAVAPLPVIAAGGIADGCGLAAALMLGAEAVRCGTRFLASAEANGHAAYQRRMLEAIAAGSASGPAPQGSPPRAATLSLASGEPSAPAELRIPRARRGSRHPGGKRYHGQPHPLDLSVAEVPGVIRAIRPAADIIRKMASDGEQILSRCRSRAQQLQARIDAAMAQGE
jgi:NAD(P)H-dependent flavin oxidoreductase YrpB (nitropropane dioxygenase family)